MGGRSLTGASSARGARKTCSRRVDSNLTEDGQEELDIVRQLTAYECDVNAEDQNGQTPLQLLCIHSQNRRLMDYLVRRGADVNKRADNRDTILHLAVAANNFKGVMLSLDNGVDVNAIGSLNCTPLLIAAKAAKAAPRPRRSTGDGCEGLFFPSHRRRK